jgi:hypothetical protein
MDNKGGEHMTEVPNDYDKRRNFVPADPTEDPNFDPSKWTGTILSGLLRSRTECAVCGAEWIDGHDCQS